FLINWQLAFIAAVTFPMFLLILIFFYIRFKITIKKQRRREGKIAARLGEVFNSAPLVRAFGRERHEIEQFEVESTKHLQEGVRALRLEAAAIRATEIISAFGLGATIFYGALQTLEGRMTPGDLLVFSAYVSRMYNPVRQVAKLLLKFNKAAVSADRLREILNEEPELPDRPDAIEAQALRGEIRFDRVSFDYGEGGKTLNEISFSVAPGERLVLVGGSGAGKSTLVNLLLRLYEPSSGAIFVDGRDIRDYRRESLRHEIGIVLQDNLLFGASIRENIAYGKLLATPEEVEAAARAAHAHEFIEALPDGYETVVGERGATLSGGQRQRIGLARAMVKRPSILILDEPTSALDAKAEALVQEVIERLQHGKTTILIVHHFRYIKDDDHVLVLNAGTIVEQGRAAELMAVKGHYYDLYLHQQSGVRTQ
ncbi:MAG: ABC transporter ATP-binding protein, partial [Pseudomonadota bacterium]|nr:ABC transporter ATP-binding protein [Pseudomonadota bacterium]